MKHVNVGTPGHVDQGALKRLCDRTFLNPMIQPYAGARGECLFCLVIEKWGGVVKHLDDCPVVEYLNICEQNGENKS